MQNPQAAITVENAQRDQVTRLDLPQQPQKMLFSVEASTEVAVQPVQEDEGIPRARCIGSSELIRKHVTGKAGSFDRLALLHQEHGNSLPFAAVQYLEIFLAQIRDRLPLL